MNSIIEIAQKHGRNYITPEDVTEALELPYVGSRCMADNKVRFELLEILGKQTDFGAEDPNLCAYIAWKGIDK